MSVILIIGANGFLGRTLASRSPSGVTVRGTTLGGGDDSIRLDITRADQVRAVIPEVSPSWVVNTAAMTNVDGCEADPEGAHRVNVEGTRNLARACEASGAGLLTLSTNYVFDGRSDERYTEGDRPSPLNVYGRTKLESEAAVLDADLHGVVVRTAVLYGYTRGAATNFVTWAASALADGQRIRIVTDEATNPTSVVELADFIFELCGGRYRGIINFAGDEVLSRYQMVQSICSRFGFDGDLVEPVTSQQLGQKAQRPLRAALAIDLARGLFTGRIAPFEEHLDRMAMQMGDPGGTCGAGDG